MYKMLQLFCAAAGFSIGLCCALMRRPRTADSNRTGSTEPMNNDRFEASDKDQSGRAKNQAEQDELQKKQSSRVVGGKKGLPEEKAVQLAQTLGAKVSAPETDPLLEVPPQEIAELRTAG